MNGEREFDAFLRAAREPFADAEAGKDAMRARLEVALGLLPQLTPLQPPAPGPVSGAPSGVVPAAIRVASAGAFVKAAALVVAGFTLGIATHAAYDAARDRPPAIAAAPSVSSVAPPPTPAKSLPSVFPVKSPVEIAEEAPPAVSPRSASAASAGSLLSKGDSEWSGELARERVLLEAARTALEHGAPADALAALDRHRRRFPDGQLCEERETLAVFALAAAGRMDEARAKTAAFHRAFPKSLQGPALDARISGSP